MACSGYYSQVPVGEAGSFDDGRIRIPSEPAPDRAGNCVCCTLAVRTKFAAGKRYGTVVSGQERPLTNDRFGRLQERDDRWSHVPSIGNPLAGDRRYIVTL